jgi:hypothetical protein
LFPALVQSTHVPPPVPHATVSLMWQTLPTQQPVGQLVASHTQLFAEHRWPLAHEPFAPHAHWPAAEQLSAFVMSQLMHIWPAAAQADAVRGVVQDVPAQQPASQLVALHAQFPDAHCCPAAHALLPPHAHWPLALQLSAVNASHAPHAVPAGAHAATDLTVHVVPEQHPASQLVASHTQCPPEQRCPAPHAMPVVPQTHRPFTQLSESSGSHATHIAPLMPQLPTDEVWHWLPAQQPLAQLAALQVQTPPTHAWPSAQGPPVPQPHWPASHTFARVESHAAQTPPSPPQCMTLGVLQVAPVQQPDAHETGLHPSHAPPSQCWPAGHAAHDEAAAPHESSVAPGRQAVPLQQPEHDVGVHAQLSFTHA